ncbi:MAG: GTPase HflX [Spirochaetaceae bacterium]|nr:MAG: GTPase HflX [Spirochaetaceae bacterium]
MVFWSWHSSMETTLYTAALLALVYLSMPNNHKAVLVGCADDTAGLTEHQASLQELSRLCSSVDIQASELVLAPLRSPSPRYLLGSGKAEEIAELRRSRELDYIVFDKNLSPSQQRNWERLAECPVMDRHEVILEIFRRRARTRQAQLQVEHAELQYKLPRLTRAWTHLSRQRGGRRGTRGEGEKQLELDRRWILTRISRVKLELTRIDNRQSTKRKRRSESRLPIGSIVGYTNAGKSSLLRTMTGAEVLVADRLFSTLDATTRTVHPEQGPRVLLSDTVGFIRHLPHSLVDAFHSTLEETVLADFLIHVLDVSVPEYLECFEATCDTLRELGVLEKPTVLVLNKVDALSDDFELTTRREKLAQLHTGPLVVCSVLKGQGIEQLSAEIRDLAFAEESKRSYLIPIERYDLVALLHRSARIYQEDVEENAYSVTAGVPSSIAEQLEAFRLTK